MYENHQPRFSHAEAEKHFSMTAHLNNGKQESELSVAHTHTNTFTLSPPPSLCCIFQSCDKHTQQRSKFLKPHRRTDLRCSCFEGRPVWDSLSCLHSRTLVKWECAIRPLLFLEKPGSPSVSLFSPDQFVMHHRESKDHKYLAFTAT